MSGDRSPCLGCEREMKEKIYCLHMCEALAAYQKGLTFRTESHVGDFASRHNHRKGGQSMPAVVNVKSLEDARAQGIRIPEEVNQMEEIEKKKRCSRPGCENESFLPNGLCRDCHAAGVKKSMKKRIGITCKEEGCNNLSTAATGRCSDCHSKLLKRARREKEKKAAQQENAKRPAEASMPGQEHNPNIIAVDFTSYLDVLKGIKEKAQAEIRPVENQIIFMLREANHANGP